MEYLRKTQSVPALERGLLILEHLAQSRRGFTLSQLTQKLQLPRSSTHALLLTYERMGYIQRDQVSGRYCIGSRLHTLANMALTGSSLRGHAASLLYQLMQATGLTVHLAVMEDGEVILIDRIAPAGGPPISTWVGKRMGLHCTALGKIFVANLSSEVVDDLIQKQGLTRYNDNTIATKRMLKMSCQEIHKLGYAIDDEEEELGVRCIGAPVYNPSGELLAAISISGRKEQLEDISSMSIQVREAAHRLSTQLGPFSQRRHNFYLSSGQTWQYQD